jgi:hypothetical protein
MSALPADLELVEAERRTGMLLDRMALDERAHARRRERSFTAREALTCLEFEALFVAVAAANLAQGVELSDVDRKRLWLASERITTIVEESVG